MHIELIDLLRCPQDHEETWLVAAFARIEDRFVKEGKLGCPVCRASYSIHGGIADFSETSETDSSSDESADPDDAMRVAAFLNLTRPGSIAVLHGRHAARAPEVSEITQCRVIALDPHVSVRDTELVATIRSDVRIPLASNSVEGAALSDSRYVGDAPRILKQGGRLVVAPSIPLPAGLFEIARDDRNLIAEAHGEVVPLRRS